MRSQSHAVFAGFLLLAGAGLLIHSYDARYEGMGVGAAVTPMFYPRILLWLWVLLAMALVVKPLMGKERNVPTQRWPALLGIVATAGAGAALMNVIGFLFSSILFCLAASLQMGYRRPLGLVLTGIVFPLATWYLFQKLLMIPLPVSPWFQEI